MVFRKQSEYVSPEINQCDLNCNFEVGMALEEPSANILSRRPYSQTAER